MYVHLHLKVRKAAKIRNRYNQVPHLTQIPHGKVRKTQLNITNKSKEVSPFTAGDNKAAMTRRESMKTQDINNTKDPQKKYRLGMVSKNVLLEGLNTFKSTDMCSMEETGLERIVGKSNLSDQFKKIIKRYKIVGYNMDIMRQSACLVVNPIIALWFLL